MWRLLYHLRLEMCLGNWTRSVKWIQFFPHPELSCCHAQRRRHTEVLPCNILCDSNLSYPVENEKMLVDAGLQTSVLQELKSKTQSTHGAKPTLTFDSSFTSICEITHLVIGAQIPPQCLFRWSDLWLWPGTLFFLTYALRSLVFILPC